MDTVMDISEELFSAFKAGQKQGFIAGVIVSVAVVALNNRDRTGSWIRHNRPKFTTS